jgi:hypothetical protein
VVLDNYNNSEYYYVLVVVIVIIVVIVVVVVLTAPITISCGFDMAMVLPILLVLSIRYTLIPVIPF